MTSRLTSALVIVPALFAATVPALGSDYCDRLQARLNQMPEVIGSGTAVHMKAETVFRLNRMETSIRRDMRALRCPSASMIAFGGQNEQDCSRLGEELNQVRAERRSLSDLEPIMSQTVDDGTGLLPAIVREMKKAHCSVAGTEQDVEVISTRGEANLPLQQAAISGRQPDDTYGLDDQQTSSSLDGDTEQDYGAPQTMDVEISGAEGTADLGLPATGEPLTEVELPKLENTDVIQGNGSIDTLRKPSRRTAAVAPAPSLSAPPIPDRDYNPNDKAVRRVGPAFLAEQETGIDLRHPADPAGSN